MSTLAEAVARMLAAQQLRAAQAQAERAGVQGGSLPTWGVSPVGRLLLLTCPRSGCQQEALVAPGWARGGYATRPCTFCFKAAKVPPQLRGAQPRHVVRKRRVR